MNRDFGIELDDFEHAPFAQEGVSSFPVRCCPRSSSARNWIRQNGFDSTERQLQRLGRIQQWRGAVGIILGGHLFAPGIDQESDAADFDRRHDAAAAVRAIWMRVCQVL